MKIAICDDEREFLENVGLAIETYLNEKGLEYNIDLYNSGKVIMELRENIVSYDVVGKRSKILSQASLHRLSDLLPLVSSYSINKKDWVNIMKEKLMRFMYGRYGVDTFGKFLLWSGVILMLITSIFHFRIFYVIGWAFVIYSYYRMFSRQTYKRALENQKFLQHTSKIRGFFAKQKYMAAQRKTHHIYKCPNCKQKIRVPKGKGKIEIRCPKCQTTFIKKS